MKVFYLLVVLSVLLWKAYYAWLRGVNAYAKDRRDHNSLFEYLLGNGALRPLPAHLPYTRQRRCATTAWSSA